eukprot:TRINITY_DN71162_c0_g1_i2.p1 TRINITY_DN71162_c0_g1~~TRINITY_DN71162_c0_g1_i2.p1  ORF type:complete len:214 (+),score=35.67 TRINITY_DN71162_c0_g1_i2:76-717(+)
MALAADLAATGEYVVIRDTCITAGPSVESDDVQEVKAGSAMFIDEIVHLVGEQRVRGRVQSPAGWISILNTEVNGRWAINVARENEEVRLALRSGSEAPESAAMRRVLARSYGEISEAHKQLITVWRSPLALFGKRALEEAETRKVPGWAIRCVQLAQQLVQEGEALRDLTDVYETQLGIASASESAFVSPISSLLLRLGHGQDLACVGEALF